MSPARAVLVCTVIWGCSPAPQDASRARTRRPDPAADHRFAELQARGRTAMGVDQYTSTHVFQSLPDGGRIELQRDSADSMGRARIQGHMGAIVAAFRAGDFTVPGFVHSRTVPGAAVMAARRTMIEYEVESLPRGAAVRLTSRDSSAIGAIHDFLAFQRQDHRAGPVSEH